LARSSPLPSAAAGTPSEPGNSKNAGPETHSLPDFWKVSLFRLAALAAIAWLVILLWLVLTTANPAVLSVEQLDTADALVTAHRVSPSAVSVDQVWFGPVPKTKQTIVNLSDLGEQQVPLGDRQFCIPLSLRNGRWWVTSLGNAKPRVYPATKAYLDLVRNYVRSHPRQRAESGERK